MPEYAFQPLFPHFPDSTVYDPIGRDHVSTATFEGREIVKIAPEGLTALAEKCFTDVAFLLRPSHMEQLAEIIKDPESSPNDRYVALELIKNAVISADRVFPMCQDTGTAIILGKKGQQVWTGGNDEDALSRGVFNAYTKNYFRYSQNAALNMYDEKNTGTNLPAQIDIAAEEGAAYKFLCIAKGGGSSNKTLSLPGDQGRPQPRLAPEVPDRKDAGDRDRGLPALSFGLCRGRDVARDRPQDGQAGLGPLLRRAADQAGRGIRLPRRRARRSSFSTRRASSAWERSSGASISPSTSGSSACRGTARPARSGWV